MATRGDAHRNQRGQRREPAAALRAGAPPGTGAWTARDAVRIVGRYRLQDRVSEAGQSSLWKAFDEVLARAVAVRTFRAGCPVSARVVAAARAACQASDHRLARVFDADDRAGSAYVVTEWPDGVHLDDLLTSGQLDVTAATAIAAEAASAIAAAHEAGIAHQFLTPRSLVWAPGVGVKITGLGVDAALAGAPLAASGQTALADTRGLARLLYAALTGYWPGGPATALPAAPQRDGRPYRPRQVRAGVPARVDEITCRALLRPTPGDGSAITTPAQLAEMLGGARPGGPRPARLAVPDTTTTALGLEPPAVGQPPPRRGRRSALAAGSLLGALLAIDSALISVSVIRARHRPQAVRAAAARPAAPSPRRRTSRWLTPVSAAAFDPYGDTHDENNQLAPAAIDADPGTGWRTFWYATARFGNLKPGTGLLLDMGRAVTVTAVTVLLGVGPGADVQLRIGDRAASPHDLRVAARANDVGGRVELRPATARRGRYVLIWFTRLPPSADRRGVFQADVYDVAVRGL